MSKSAGIRFFIFCFYPASIFVVVIGPGEWISWYYKNTVLRPVWYYLVFIQFNLKVYIYLPSINTQRQKKAPFDKTPVISSSDHQKSGIYQGLSYSHEGDQNSDLICLLQKSQEIHYCNQSVLKIFPELDIFIFSIIIVDIILISALVEL